MPTYQEQLQSLRRLFPQPGSDPAGDRQFAFTVLEMLERIDVLKSSAPVIGTMSTPDDDAARSERIAGEGRSLDALLPELVGTLAGMWIGGHPANQVNIVPHPTWGSILGVLLPALYNPNLCSDESGAQFSAVEVRVAAMVAELVGYRPEQAAGVFTFGGTGGLLYAVKVGLEKAVPGSSLRGVRDDVVILASEQSHYSVRTVAAWLGIGQENVILVPADDQHAISLPILEERLRDALARKQKIAAIVATMGTTDAFGIDDLEAIAALRDRLAAEYGLDYRPHVHADAVIGWAWSMFNDYDFQKNPLELSARTAQSLSTAQQRIAHLHRADSIGVDFHKNGFTPYVSSLILFADVGDLSHIARTKAEMPYLYQSGLHHPGMFTLETSRSAAGPLAALASLLLLGKQGFRVLLGHAVEMAEVLRDEIRSHAGLALVNAGNVGPATLVRAYPEGGDAQGMLERERYDTSCRAQLAAHNAYNRRLFELLQFEARAGRGVLLSLTDCPLMSAGGEPIVALKSFVLSPFAEAAAMRAVVRELLAARAKLSE